MNTQCVSRPAYRPALAVRVFPQVRERTGACSQPAFYPALALIYSRLTGEHAAACSLPAYQPALAEYKSDNLLLSLSAFTLPSISSYATS